MRRWKLRLIQTAFDWGRRGKIWFWPDIWRTVKGLIKKWENIAVTIGGSVVSEKCISYIFAFAWICYFEGIITLFCRGEHQESGVKIITSFHLRLIFFLAISFFSFSFVIILKICVKSSLELTLNPTVTNADQKVVFNTWSIFWDLKAYRAQSAGKQSNWLGDELNLFRMLCLAVSSFGDSLRFHISWLCEQQSLLPCCSVRPCMQQQWEMSVGRWAKLFSKLLTPETQPAFQAHRSNF